MLMECNYIQKAIFEKYHHLAWIYVAEWKQFFC